MTRQMSDSAYPMTAPPPGGWRNIILIYAGGDTVHPWSDKEIASMPSRYRWPCFVRSDPTQVSAAADASWMTAWLTAHHVPKGTCVILDLEVAVDGAYTGAFNLALRAAGYKVTKYGSGSVSGTGPIWGNPKTDGGTFIADPDGVDALPAFGDLVAKQYAFDGSYDLSKTLDQGALPLWDTKPPAPPGPPYRHLTAGGDTIEKLAASRNSSAEGFLRRCAQYYTPADMALLEMAKLPADIPWYSVSP